MMGKMMGILSRHGIEKHLLVPDWSAHCIYARQEMETRPCLLAKLSMGNEWCIEAETLKELLPELTPERLMEEVKQR